MTTTRRRRRPHHEGSVIIVCGGKEYTASQTMAHIFMKRAGRVMAGGGSELVPLLHVGGIELLHITPSTPVEMRALDVRHHA